MTIFYDYGIDLGTTNSCISTSTENGIKIYQNLDNMNVTPSAIYIGKNGRMLVGRRAYDKMIYEPENTAVEFKRLMGLKTIKGFEGSSKELTPVEMSSELLKSMREDVFRQMNTYVNYAVITVPAAFGTIQCEDTYKAAELAGFKKVVLLQEPIAAAIAYGAEADAKDQYWMVFDFGGGTLDIAIISTHDGRLKVVNHEGDNYLGGKDIDEIIYKEIILPELAAKFNLPENPRKMEYIHKKLLIVVEDAKKTLSTADTVDIDIFDICDDVDGTPIECRINLSLTEFNKSIEPIIEKCISLCEKAIKGSKVIKEDINRILMVGGTTFLPAIRDRLKNQYGIKLDTSIDPMTVVAQGAAIYGSTYRVTQSDEDAVELPDGDVLVQLEFVPITFENTANIIGKFNSNDPSLLYGQVKIDDESGIWTSGWIDVLDEGPGVFDVDVMLQKNKTNYFRVSARNKDGEILRIHGDCFQIRHKDNVLITSAPPIPHSLCVEIDLYGQRVLERMIIKGTVLPAKAVKRFKANKTLKPGKDDFISIKIWEGEMFEIPESNQWVGNIYVHSKSITRSIPEGVDVEITIGIDESRKITVSAFIPHIDETFSGALVYNAEQLDLQKPMKLLGDDIRVLYSKIEEIKYKAIRQDVVLKVAEYERELRSVELEHIECNRLKGEDDDRVIQLLNRFNFLKGKVHEFSRLQKASNKYSSDLEEIQEMETVIRLYGDEDGINEFAELYKNYLKVDSGAESRGKQYYKEKMLELHARVLLNNPTVLMYLLSEYCNPKKRYIDEKQAMHWREQGLIAIKDYDLPGMREACINLLNLSDQDILTILCEKELPPDLKG